MAIIWIFIFMSRCWMGRGRKVAGIIFEMCLLSLCQVLILVFLITEIKKDLEIKMILFFSMILYWGKQNGFTVCYSFRLLNYRINCNYPCLGIFVQGSNNINFKWLWQFFNVVKSSDITLQRDGIVCQYKILSWEKWSQCAFLSARCL